ncbi:unnamed protein product [Thelazia callipaeda]|uniref:UBA domain-containing protein n=1 Tax=Thelazia callipaeda TaxID=103827 RepID=A0A0N5D126_THECL|nr:unnamed protein product [Thelazia callipaeda]
MGGKNELGDQKIRATQDQLRIARLTQDLSITDDDRANIQKLVKKVVETTRCTVTQAEIALYDNNNDVQEAVNAILEDNYSDENVWKEQKSRRAKRAEAEELKHEELNAHRNRLNSGRSSNNFGYGRGRGTERGRSSYRGGRGSARGSYRGGYQQSSLQGQFSSNMGSNMWDNSQALKINMSKDWTNTSNAAIDDNAEDTEWKQHGTLVFSRSATPPTTTPAVSMVAGISSVTSTSGPVSFAAVAASGTNKAKESLFRSSVARTKPAGSLSMGQSQNESVNSLYQNTGLVSTSSQITATSEEADKESEVRTPPITSRETSSSAAGTAKTVQTTMASQQSRAAGPVTAVTNTSADWTTQLKNDLGIGGTATTVSKSSATQPGLAPKALLQAPKVGQVSRPAARHSAHSNTVEFVSGESSGPTLPEYQFGFHVDSAAGNDEHADDVYGTSSKSRTLSSHAPKTEVNADSSTSILSNGPVADYSSSISAQQQPKISSGNSSVSLSQASPAVHQANTIQRQPVTSGLSYADTSSMSYPSSDNRNTTKLPLSLHHQQQAPHALYTTTQLPYANYPYLNMYSPVAGVRQDEYAAALVQYPFGVGQFDMNSISTMLPPAAAALASQQQQNQPPPSVQSQHQQRPDQHPSIVDLSKAYLATAAAAAVNSSIASGTGSGILGTQQQRDSAVPPAAYHPQINQLPFSFMLPNVTNGQHKLNHQMFAQQSVEDALSEQRLSSQQQKVGNLYQGHQQLDKYGSSTTTKDRLGGGPQATPPPQVYQTQGYMSQQMPLHGHKKTYGGGPQHWSAS